MRASYSRLPNASDDDPRFSVIVANRFGARLRGLFGQAPLPPDRALWLIPCRAVHTVGMRVPIDVAFVARDGTVLRVLSALAPGRVAVCWSAHSAIEMRVGTAAAIGLRNGVRWPHLKIKLLTSEN
jgi:uncharacterized protein